MATYEDEGRAPIIIDTTFHETDRIPVDIGVGITLSGSDIELGAVELKDGVSDNRATITGTGDLQVTLAGEIPSVDVTGQGDVPVTLGGEVVQISGVMSLQSGDIEIGAVEIKDGSSDNRAVVNSRGGLFVAPAGDVTVLRAQIDASSTSNTLVAAVGGEQIKVLSMLLVVADTVSGRFRSGAGNYLTGGMALDATGAGFALMAPSDLDMHWMETAAGEALILELDTSVYVGGLLTYYTE